MSWDDSCRVGVTMKQLITRQDLEKLSHHNQIRFACFSAEQVLHLVLEEHKPVCMRAIQVAYLFLDGKATTGDCLAAAYAAYAAAYAANAANAAAAAANAAYAAAANAAAAAANAAYAAAANAAYAAANAAAAAANAAYAAAANAANAAYAKDRQTIIDAQWEYYDQLLNADKIFEDIVLGARY